MEIIALQMTIQTNLYQSSRFYSSSKKWSGNILNHFQNSKDYFSLKEINLLLSEENAKLKNIALLKSISKNNLISKIPYQYISAKVIKNSYNKRNNYLTINKGSIHGVENGMGVCSKDGVVGIIRDVSPHYSTVMSILNKKTTISSRFLNSNHFGELRWNGKSHQFAQLHSIEKFVPVSIGDSLFTNSYSSVFPNGIPIGIVNRFEINELDNFYKTIEVDLHVDFSNINFIYILTNPLQKERLNLEKLQIQNE